MVWSYSIEHTTCQKWKIYWVMLANFLWAVMMTICRIWQNFSGSCIDCEKKRTALVKKIITACTPLQPVPHLYIGLPKTHKPGNPMRPIISTVGSFNHEAAKWLSNVLAPLRHHSTIIRDTSSFAKEIQNNDLRSCVMASFDVKSVFTNIPLKFTTNLVVKSLFHDGCTQFQGISQTQMKKLLKWICQSTTFQFNGKFYKQIDGVAMGSPIAPLLADVIMNHVIDQALTKVNVHNKPIVLRRYVDYIFPMKSAEKCKDLYAAMPSRPFSFVSYMKLISWKNLLHIKTNKIIFVAQV